jgi:hypothetical protein
MAHAYIFMMCSLDTCTWMQVLMLAVLFASSYIPSLGTFHFLSYRMYMITVATTHLIRLTHAAGLPQLQPFSWQILQTWASTVGGTSDAHYLLVAFSFLGQRPMVMLMVGPAILAALRLASFLNKRMPSLQPAFEPLLAKRVRAVLIGYCTNHYSSCS